jgi:RHH-type proline utilization regulon transcriptional repressor/proline dehydrogenase/delta 1-pyrroline-5-carboxylate dehydrogenase
MQKPSTSEVLEWARDFLSQSEKEISPDEIKEQKKYAILIQNPNDKILLSKMLDESSQIHDSRKLAKRMKRLIEQYGVPSFFSSSDAFLLKLFTAFGYWFDFISVPIFKQRLRSDTAKVIINEKASYLNRHLSERREQQIGQNVNLLGEVVLGNAEADKRYKHYLEALKDPQINYISIKISGIYAQINALNYEQNKLDLCERLACIYQQSIDFKYIDEDGNAHDKFVNLDMEEYKDAELTLDIFRTVLSRPAFKQYRAGIVIQAYLPDAWNLQTELLEFARKRFAEGGAPLKMRLVKGANLQMESITSSLKGWENPVLHSKVEVDANYLHLLDRALEPENIRALHVGVASHNLFSIGYAYLLGKKLGVEEFVTFEMLEGMANHLPRVMRGLGKQIILYTPVVKNEHFLNAVSYLVRRLDENTGKDNFLSYSFGLTYESKQWQFLKEQFLQAYSIKDALEAKSYRTQDRTVQVPLPDSVSDTFHNEPDTNFDLRVNRMWAASIRSKWKRSVGDQPWQVPVQVGDRIEPAGKLQLYFDRSQTGDICVCEAGLSNLDQVKRMIDVAQKDDSNWRKATLEERSLLLHRVAANLCNERGNLIGCMAAITGKTFAEGDVEVSEAIDFCRYYPTTMRAFAELESVQYAPKGIVLVIPPWNFPLAIPVGGVAAALAGGNTVLLKPATVALPVAWAFAQCFWDAGIPKDALQVVCTAGREPLNHLTAHPSIKHIILTGGTDTAFRLLENNPSCPLSAETGGKNAILLTASGDRDHAIQNIVTSAFSNAGQKCSACSLLLVEKTVYNDSDFKTKLVDAVTSLQTGGVWNGGTYVGPMITNENEKLLHAIDHLESGEHWLVKPSFVDAKRFMLRPSVKWGVKPGNFTFVNELFAPLLSVVCIDNLEQGIRMLNEETEFGLTSGLQSLDETEQQYWKDHLEAGNLYINRGITGAIVNRQPFGGMKRSAFGGGIKAGGRNYVACFVDFTEHAVEDRLEAAVQSYRMAWNEEFSREEDVNNLYGEKNTFRYLPLRSMVLRVAESDDLTDIRMVVAAARVANTPLTLSIAPGDSKEAAIRQGETCPLRIETEDVFLDQLDAFERIRTSSNKLSDNFYRKAASLGKYIATAKPIVEGRIELLHYLKEQSIAFEYHRYGSITGDVQ